MEHAHLDSTRDELTLVSKLGIDDSLATLLGHEAAVASESHCRVIQWHVNRGDKLRAFRLCEAVSERLSNDRSRRVE